MTWDPDKNGLVLFGGVTSGGAYHNDTWLFSSGAWSVIQADGASGAPPKRQAASLAYSTATSQLVLFGGQNNVAQSLGDTWLLGTSSWSQQSPTTSPPARYAAGFTYDPGLGGAVLFGGFNANTTPATVDNDTWGWNGSTWLQAANIAAPAARYGVSMAATTAGQLVMFGGNTGASIVNDTWMYDTNVPVLGVSFSDSHGNPATAFETGDSVTVNLSAQDVGVNPISATTITSTLSSQFLALGSLVSWAGTTLGPCSGGSTVCGAILGLSATIGELTFSNGTPVAGAFTGTLVGSVVGCTILTIPATAANAFGQSAVASAPLTACGGGLGKEDWWTYNSTDLGNGATAGVNVANGNLMLKQTDSTPIDSHGQLGFELGRAYNSQGDMAAPTTLGDGWQFDFGRTGPSGMGGFELGSLLVPDLQSAAQPLSVTYVDGDGTRQVFSLHGVSATVGPINLTQWAQSALDPIYRLLDPHSLPYPLTSSASGDSYNTLCIDVTYTPPPGLDEYLFRYVGLVSNNSDCSAVDSSPSAVTVGWSLVRPDRVRYDFNPRGQLLDVADGAGNKMVYKFDEVDRLIDVHSAHCTPASSISTPPLQGPACPGYSIAYSEITLNGTQFNRVDVTDPADRITTYIVSRGFQPELLQVWDPGNPYTQSGPATPSESYTYSSATTPCPGSASGAVTVSALCSATDADGNTTTFAYRPSPVGPDQVMTIKDRRANVAGGATSGSETLFTYGTDASGTPYVTADTAAPATFGSATPPTGCTGNAACERIRYSSIDTSGRVGEVDEGDAADDYLRQQAYLWDGDAIPNCEQPDNAVDNNLCETITRGAPSASAFSVDGVGTETVNGVTVADQGVKYVYGDMGQLLSKTVIVDPSNGWDTSKADITTYSSHEQYFEAGATVRTFDDTVQGAGQVTSTSPAGSNTYAAAVSRNNPTAYYQFDETALATTLHDASSNGHNGNLDLGAPRRQPGQVDYAVNELGGKWTATVNSSGFASATSSAFSEESWVKTTNTGLEYQTIAGLNSNAYAAVGRYTGGQPAVVIASDVANHHAIKVVGNESIADGQWHQLDVTYDGQGHASGVHIYVDGNLLQGTTVYSDTLNGPFASASSELYIGDSTSVSGVDKNSSIDELSIYPTELSGSAISDLYSAATAGIRRDAGTLYAIDDQTQVLPPRGNTADAASHWGDYLTTYRRDIPAAGTASNSYPRPNQTMNGSVCSPSTSNTGLLCETDSPSSALVVAGAPCQSPTANVPNSPAPPSTSGHPYACTTATYNSWGEKTTLTSPDGNALGGGPARAITYTYYNDTGDCTSDRNDCDLSGHVSLGGMLKAVTDQNGNSVLFAYDRAGNLARTWDRNATQNKALTMPWTSSTAPPSNQYSETDHANPVTSALLSAGGQDTEIVTSDGTVRGSGANSAGELGNLSLTATTVPAAASGLAHVVEIAQTSSTCHYTLARTSTGALYQWGNGTTVPTHVTGLPPIIAIAAGGCHLLALDNTGQVWAWGSNSNGQLGNGTTTDSAAPIKINLGNGRAAAAIAAGGGHSLAVLTDGTVLAWGDNSHGQLGDGTTTGHTQPTAVSALTGVLAVSAGSDTSYAIKADGSVWSWGNNTAGALGTGSAASQAATPQHITVIGQATAPGPVRQIAAGNHSAAALLTNGNVEVWGDNSNGQLAGATTNASSSTPLLVTQLSGQVALAGNASTYLTADPAGRTTIWGTASAGQIGDGSTPSSAVLPQTASYNVSPFTAPWRYAEGHRDPIGNLSLTTADPNGEALISRPARGTAVVTSAYDTVMSYDADGNRVSALAPMERASDSAATTVYDVFGNPTVNTDPRGNATVNSYDSLDRAVQVQTTRSTAQNSTGSGCTTPAPSGGPWPALQVGHLICTTSVIYDGLDNQITSTDANGQTTTTTYDGAGEKTAQTMPRNDGTYTTLTTEWNYDPDGNVTDICPPRQFDSAHEQDTTSTCTATGAYSTHTSYDNADRSDSTSVYRVTGGSSGPPETTGRAYDADGNVISVTDANGHTTTTAYDLLDRKTSQLVPRTASVSEKTTWQYDASGNVTAILAPGARYVGNGNDGPLVVDGSTHPQSNPYKIPDAAQYTSVTLQNGGWVTGTTANGLSFTATGDVTICVTCGITEAGNGYTGGAGAQAGLGQAAGKDASNPKTSGGNGGLGGAAGSGTGSGGGGGGGGHTTAGTAGTQISGGGAGGAGGATSGKPDFSDVGTTYLNASGGGGGGGGQGLTTNKGGNGGNGGGYIHIAAATITVTGTIDASGTAGGAANNKAGGGGGGAGGGIWLEASTVTGTSNINVNGGAGGTSAGGANGGSGAAGQKRIDTDSGFAHSQSSDVTAYSYDADNRLVDTVRGAQTLSADPTVDDSINAVPDPNGLFNQRARNVYDADGHTVMTLPPQAFTPSDSTQTQAQQSQAEASLLQPTLDAASRSDYDLDGRPAATYDPRYNNTVTDVSSGGDGGTSLDQQGTECPTGADPTAAGNYAGYGGSVGVCITHATYDADGNLVRQSQLTGNGADKRFTAYSYTDDNLRLSVSTPDPNGGTNTTTQHTYLYDGDGRPISDTDANGNTTITQYTADGLTAEIDGQAYTLGSTQITHKTINHYDASGNLTTSEDPNGQSPATGLTAADYVTTTTWTSDGYTAAIQRPGLAHSDFDKTTYTYDAVGNPKTVTSPSANATDANNPAGLATVNTFTADNLIASSSVPIASGNYRTTIYAYTPSGQKASTQVGLCTSSAVTDCVPANAAWHPGSTLSYTYAPDGLNIQQIGRNQAGGTGTRSITTSYDQAGRPISIADNTSQITVNAGYYLDGTLRTTSDGTNSNTYAYNAAAELTVRTDQTSSAGITGGASKATSYAYNDAGLPRQITSDVTNNTSTWTYDPTGRPIGRVDKNASGTTIRTTSLSFNPDQTLAATTVYPGSSSGSALATNAYTYFNNGDIHTETVSGTAQTFTNAYAYNAADNLTSFAQLRSGATTTTSYTRDHDANRLSTTTGSTTSSSVYQADNSLRSQTTAGTTLTFGYSNAGEVSDNGCYTYVYDEFERVAQQQAKAGAPSSCGTGNGTTQYTYDGLDRQQQETVTGTSHNTTTKNSYDGLANTLVGQTGARNGAFSNPTVLYQLNPTGGHDALAQTSSGTTTTALLDTDGQGNVTSLVNSGDTSAACAANYDPYGNPIAAASGSNGICNGGTAAGTTANSVWYRDQKRDAVTGNYQLGARTYDPTTGSFTTPDSYRVSTPSTDLGVGTDPLTANTYAYVNGNPVNFADPDGHCVKIDSASTPCLSATKSALPTYDNNQLSGFTDGRGHAVGGRGCDNYCFAKLPKAPCAYGAGDYRDCQDLAYSDIALSVVLHTPRTDDTGRLGRYWLYNGEARDGDYWNPSTGDGPACWGRAACAAAYRYLNAHRSDPDVVIKAKVIAATYCAHHYSECEAAGEMSATGGATTAILMAAGPAAVELRAALEGVSAAEASAATAETAQLGWSVGGDVYSLTNAGNEPSWATVRARFWKNEAADPQVSSQWSQVNLDRMRRGLAPQRYNPDKGGMESMELSHEPVPHRDGGRDFVPRWPCDHAAVDPYRTPGYC